MIRTYINQDNLLRRAEIGEALAFYPETVWIDLLNPTPDEEKAVQAFLHIDIPTREEMQEIELSSRLYQENGVLFMTATLVANIDNHQPESHAVTFILTSQCLVTIRYIDPQPFRVFSYRSERLTSLPYKSEIILVGLLEAIVDRVADVLEKVGHNLDGLTQDIFRPGKTVRVSNTSKDNKEKTDFGNILQAIGTNGDMVSKTRESLVSVIRLLTFLNQALTTHTSTDALKRISTLGKDLSALGDHANFLSNKVNFLLDATLGMISIEQNNIIKIFSVAAVVFLPPTLIASIYGMNFHRMPELNWVFGYPTAIILMILSGWLPYRFFKRKGWL